MKKVLLFSFLFCFSGLSVFAKGSTTIAVADIFTIQKDTSCYELFVITNTEDSTPAYVNSFRFVSGGDYTEKDVDSFYLYRNKTNSLVGATLLGAIPAKAPGGQTINFDSVLMPANATLYYMLYVKFSKSPVPGHAIYIMPYSTATEPPFNYTGEQPEYIYQKSAPVNHMVIAGGGGIKWTSRHFFDNCMAGIGAGYSTIYGDLKKSDPKAAVILDFAKPTNMGVVVALELQHGAISSCTPANKWTNGLCETNRFNALNVNARYYLSYMMPRPKNIVTKILSKCYAGAGLGVIDNDLINITNKFRQTDATTLAPDMKTRSMEMILPMNLGLNVSLKKLLDYHDAQLNINYNMVYSFGDYVDGYSFVRARAKNNYNDFYTILSVGVSFNIKK